MKILNNQPSLVEQVHSAILSEIASGNIPSGTHIVQEKIARTLGVSRQPVQHALTLLRNQGVLHDAAGRGLFVAPLNLDHVRQMYELRAVIEGLAFRNAAQNNAAQARLRGPALVKAGKKASASGAKSAMISADMAFHQFIYSLSGNPLLGAAMETHFVYAQRVMGEVIQHDDKHRDIWDQHQEMLDCVASGKAGTAERLAKKHILEAADFMIDRLRAERGQAAIC